MAKEKILYIVESFGSGVFSFLVDLVNGLCNEYDIVIAYGKRKETLENFKDYFSEKVKFIEVKNFTRSINLKKDINALQEVRKIIKKEKPNIIHLHSSKAGIIGRLASHNRKIKIYYNPHGFSFLKKDDSVIKRFIYRTIEKGATIINHRCTIIGCSKGEYEEARKLNRNSVCINNGINIKKLEEEIKGLNEKKIDYNNLRVCTVGRIGFQKNPKMFNKIAEQLPNLQFMWIGDGELKEELKSPNIKITGWLERKEVLKELNNNDIFILPSLWEGLPISLLEAMYMKKICIVSDVIGNRDVIENGENGFVASNSEEFVKKILQVRNNNITNNIINNAKNDVLDSYNNSIMTKKYIQLYKSNRG